MNVKFKEDIKKFATEISSARNKKESLKGFVQKLKNINSSENYSIESITLEKSLEDLVFVDFDSKDSCQTYQNSLFVSFGVRGNTVKDLPEMVRLAHQIAGKLCVSAK